MSSRFRSSPCVGRACAALGALAAIASTGCSSSDSASTSADAAVGPPSDPATTESRGAADRIAEIRSRFAITPLGRPKAPLVDAPARPPRPILGEAIVERFEHLADGRLKPILPPLARRGVLHTASVVLPALATREVELEDDATRLAVKFALQGALDRPAETANGIALYRGALAGADLVHRVHAEGTEDFVVFETKPAVEELAYRVDISRVAGLRLVSNTLEFLDASGTPRLRVAPPYVVDAKGERRDARLVVERCAYDTNPAGPWGRAVTPAGNHECAIRVSWALSPDQYPAMLDPAWVATGSMTVGRVEHVATVLASGKVLIAGGGSTADLYDATSGTWSATGAMALSRLDPTANLLGNGKVLVAGGSTSATNPAGRLSTAELYNPASGTWSATGSMKQVRQYHTASVLLNGKVLVAAGGTTTSNFSSSAELYDTASGTWSTTGSLSSQHYLHAAAVLPGGAVLVAGGGSSVAEIYNPALGTWSTTGPMNATRNSLAMALLASGKVLVAGGDDYSSGSTVVLSTAELYDPTLGAWSNTASMSGLREFGAISVLANGKAIIAGGYVSPSLLSTAELYDASVGTWGTAGVMTAARQGPTASVLANGKVLVAGGRGSLGPLSSAELFRLMLGAACSTSSDCSSDFCVDGVCCNTSCSAQCAACDVAGTVGTCSPVVGKTHGSRTSCSTAECGLACDGVDATACHFPKTSCGVNACSSGTETHTSTCNGMGACGDVPRSCAPYLCGPTQCSSSCTSVADCTAGFECKLGVCTTGSTPVLGSPCTAASSCPAGAFCTDGVCCSAGKCDPGSSCATTVRKGTCAKLPGTSCTTSAECGSDACVDGVCCDRACTGQCEACDGVGSSGTCTAVVGAPHGARAACVAGTADVCVGRACDGKNALACNGFVGKEATCHTASCAGSTFTPAATCNGMGSCGSPPSGTCAPYACDTNGCRTSCATDADCALGNACTASSCTPRAGQCSTDLTTATTPTGEVTTCYPVLCIPSKGQCGDTCQSAADCASPFVCDTQHNCVNPPSLTSGSGGCANSARAPRGGLAAGGIALAALLLRHRRRRAFMRRLPETRA
jgi:hypothetical protein